MKYIRVRLLCNINIFLEINEKIINDDLIIDLLNVFNDRRIIDLYLY